METLEKFGDVWNFCKTHNLNFNFLSIDNHRFHLEIYSHSANEASLECIILRFGATRTCERKFPLSKGHRWKAKVEGRKFWSIDVRQIVTSKHFFRRTSHLRIRVTTHETRAASLKSCEVLAAVERLYFLIKVYERHGRDQMKEYFFCDTRLKTWKNRWKSKKESRRLYVHEPSSKSLHW